MNKLDHIIEELRRVSVPEELAEEAAARVRRNLFVRSAGLPERIRSCADYQALIPAYLSRSLSAGRALLLQDHTRECVACRHALEQARSGAAPTLVRPVTMPSRTISKVWTIAALAILTIGATVVVALGLRTGSAGPVAVHSVSGILYAVSDAGSVPIFAGRQIAEGEIVRTSKESTAVVKLGDGSLVEMNERSELSVSNASRGVTVRLQRGDIIVQAAKQRSGTLNVSTPDALISVKGTVFAVNRGTKGSRVSVIEGAVSVEQGRQSQMLKPGEQIVTDASLEKIPVQDAIAWSRDSAKHLALMGEFAVLQKRLESVRAPELRYQSKLIGYVPGDTILFAAIPNMGATLGEAQKLFDQRIQESPVLRDWWKEQNEGAKLQEMIQKLRTFSDYLGDEVVFSVAGDREGQYTPPLILAETKRPGLQAFLETEIRQMRIQGRKELPRIVEIKTAPEDNNQFYRRERGAAAVKGEDEMLFAFGRDMVAIAWTEGQLDEFSRRLREGPRSPGHGLLANANRAYQKGVGWLLSVNMEHIAYHSVSKKDRDNKKALPPGLDAMRYLIVERKDIVGKTENAATLSFEGRRSGMAAWLAEPAPMGTLDFVSPNALMAISLVVREPRAMMYDLIQYLRSQNASTDEMFDRIYRETGVRPVEDIGEALGSEVTFAIDGPLFPVPAWKLAVEVYSPERLQWAIDKLLEAVNRDMTCANCKVQLVKEQVGTRSFFKLTTAALPYELHYTFADGYLVAASSRTDLTRALDNRATGYVLARSETFRAQLPRDGRSNFSALLFGNFESVVKPLAAQLGSVSALSPEQRASIQALADNSGAGLIYAYGEPERIVVASRGATFGLDLGTLALPQILGKAMNPTQGAAKTQ